MSYYMTSDDLIKSVRRRALIPTVQSLFKSEDFLAFANEEMNLGLVPTVLRVHEDYFLYTVSIPLEQNKTKYTIPYRAIGNKVRDVAFKDGNGNVFEMTRIGIGDLPFYNGNYSTNKVYAFYISNNEICLAPDSSTIPTGTFLQVTFYIRPNTLVLLEDVAPITSIDRDTGEITVSNLPSDFTTSSLFDLIKIQSPHKTLNYDLEVVAIDEGSKIITLNPDDIPETLSAGDHICLATESAIPQVPSDLHVMLAHRVATRCLEALGDTEGLQNANQKLVEMEQTSTTLIDDRVEDSPKKIVNRHATIRTGLVYRRGFRR